MERHYITVNSDKLDVFCVIAKDHQIKILSTRDLGNGLFRVLIGCYVAITLFNFGISIGLYSSIASKN